ncbi:YciI family protein [Paenirhodobacter enshiensis]|uniref:YciI family protein n=1 Tax=Paenirhodobacter enshiensis TaxID=1105367 RepID=UPI0035ADFB7E
MPVLSQDTHIFVVDLEYTAPMERIEGKLDAHRRFLDENYARGRFLASGPKEPRTGGVILALGTSRAEIETLLESDPFKALDLARYTVTEFHPVKAAPALLG